MTTHHALLFRVASPLMVALQDPQFSAIETKFSIPQFGINNVRQLISDAHRRPDGEEHERLILVATEFITEEAQQALLKIIEEPPVSTKFWFLVPTGYTLLPTLESRFEEVVQTDVAPATPNDTFLQFIAASYSERLQLIDEAVKQKKSAWQAEIKAGLIVYLGSSKKPHSVTVNKELEYIVRLLLTRGASNKMLLEHLALVLPT